ncbi:hypothetical protein M0805_003326 [Coniferiporia weirii]|nr:hypothetical protein M0805_003326 [Coniferiporia weirii]
MALMAHRSTSLSVANTSFSSTSLAREHTPPPTCNHLDAAQRSRFIRTSRKLGKVLGTTPYIADPFPALPALSMTRSLTDAASKRRSAPPTPAASYTSFDFPFPPSVAHSGEMALSRTSTVSDTESDFHSTSRFILDNAPLSRQSHSRKRTVADVLSPLPSFPGLDASRNNRKHQPMLRLPPPASGAAPNGFSSGSPLRATFSLNNGPDQFDLSTSKRTPPSVALPPRSPTSPTSPASFGAPATPPASSYELTDSPPDEQAGAHDPDAFGDDEDEEAEAEARLRKRRMNKLMRHLGEYVPSELVFGPKVPRASSSGISPGPATLPTPVPPVPKPAKSLGSMVSVTGTKDDRSLSSMQAKVMRRVSVVSSPRPRAYVEGRDVPSGYRSGPEEGEQEIKNGTFHLVEDEWTPEAYEDVVKRLRRLK